MLKKITSIAVLGLFVLVLSGCVSKTEAPSETSVPLPAVKKDNLPPASPSAQEEALPKATGQVDDLVNAVSAEADSEKATLADEESIANDTAIDVEEINNLSNYYDENEL